MLVDQRLRDLGIVLPRPPEPIASYVSAVPTGRLLYLSGHGPVRPDGTLLKGVVGRDLSVDEAREAARLVGLGLLATIQKSLGSLDSVTRVVKVFGMVNSTPDFEQHPAVINGCSDLLVEVFGDVGTHARSAVGVGSLPGGIPVEIEAIVEFAPPL